MTNDQKLKQAMLKLKNVCITKTAPVLNSSNCMSFKIDATFDLVLNQAQEL